MFGSKPEAPGRRQTRQRKVRYNETFLPALGFATLNVKLHAPLQLGAICRMPARAHTTASFDTRHATTRQSVAAVVTAIHSTPALFHASVVLNAYYGVAVPHDAARSVPTAITMMCCLSHLFLSLQVYHTGPASFRCRCRNAWLWLTTQRVQPPFKAGWMPWRRTMRRATPLAWTTATMRNLSWGRVAVMTVSGARCHQFLPQCPRSGILPLPHSVHSLLRAFRRRRLVCVLRHYKSCSALARQTRA